MLLQDKIAVVYGGAGAIGAAAARTFAREGARVFLAGRTADRLKAVAADIVEGGGDAEWAVVDALDPVAVRAHADEVVAAAGGLDISFNAIGVDHVQGQPLTELAPADSRSRSRRTRPRSSSPPPPPPDTCGSGAPG